MPMMSTSKETAATAVTGQGNYVSLHTADPGTTGANEAVGGSYARVPTTWAAGAVDGIVTGTQVTVNVAAGTYRYAGLWSALNGGTWLGSCLIPDTTLASDGQIKVTPTYTQS